jgi:hypothetical protein
MNFTKSQWLLEAAFSAHLCPVDFSYTHRYIIFPFFDLCIHLCMGTVFLLPICAKCRWWCSDTFTRIISYPNHPSAASRCRSDRWHVPWFFPYWYQFSQIRPATQTLCAARYRHLAAHRRDVTPNCVSIWYLFWLLSFTADAITLALQFKANCSASFSAIKNSRLALMDSCLFNAAGEKKKTKKRKEDEGK